MEPSLPELLKVMRRTAHYWHRRHLELYPLEDYLSAGHQALAEVLRETLPPGVTLQGHMLGRCRSLMADVARHGLGGDPRTKRSARVLSGLSVVVEFQTCADRLEQAVMARQWWARLCPSQQRAVRDMVDGKTITASAQARGTSWGAMAVYRARAHAAWRKARA